MKKQFLLLLLLYSAVNFAQLQNNHWYFGNHAHLNFNGSIPGFPVAVSQPSTQNMPINSTFNQDFIEGCATISDYNTGNLRFYSNGYAIYGANHQIITNGAGLKGNASSTQNIVFLPKPKDNNIFYAFTIDGVTSALNKGLFYSEINVAAASVSGIRKNIPLKDHEGINVDESYYNPNNMSNLDNLNQSEDITTARHSNGVDYWVIAHVNNFIYTYLVDCTGVHLMPAKTYSLRDRNPNIINPSSGNHLKIDQSNKTIVRIAGAIGIDNMQNCLSTGTFNRSTGEINLNNVVNNSTSNVYAVEFSRDGEILYFGNINQLRRYRFSTNTTNVLATNLPVFNPLSPIPGVFGMQMAPDGTIYTSIHGQRFLGRINNTEDFVNATYTANTVVLLPNTQINFASASVGLPQLVQWQAPLPPVTLVVNNDVISANSCTTTTSAITVQSNDTANGTLITSPLTGLVITPLGLPNPTPIMGGITLNANGTITVLVGTPIGTYTLPYQICTAGSCPTCSNTGVITVNVSGGGNVLVAVNDTFNYDECILMKMNVKYNNPTTSDSINGNPILPTTTGITVQQIPNSLSPIPATGNITINANGFVSVAAGTPSGTYTLKYKLILNDRCASESNEATVTINVNPSAIVQNFTTSDDYICIFPGQTSTVSIFDNDTIGGLMPTASNTVIAYDDFGLAPGITVNPNGTISVAAGTPNGAYLPGYYLSQKCLSSNISRQQKISIIVGLTAIGDGVMTNTSGSVLNGNTNILTNDRFGCDPLDPTSVSISYVSNPYFSINTIQGNPNFGQITLTAPSYALGSYFIPCTVTQLANPAFTDTYNITLTVLSSLRQSSDNNPKEEVRAAADFNIYPNPSSGIFNLQLGNTEASGKNFKLSVYNVLGQLVVEKTINENNAQVDLSNFENGTYFLKIQMGNETINKVIIKK